MKMNRFLVLAFSLLTGALGCYANAVQDTTFVVNQAKKVTIEKTSNSFNVTIEGSAHNPNYFYSQSIEIDSIDAYAKECETGFDFDIPFVDNKKERMKLSTTSFGFGLVTALDAPDGMNVDMAASYELAIDHLWKVSYYFQPTTSVSLGFGMTWRNYRMTGHTRFIKEDSQLSLGAYPEGADIKFSRLKVFSLNVPVMLNQALGKKFVLSVGPVINFNTYGSVKTRYTLNGEKVKDLDKNIHQNKMTIDLMAKLRYKWLGAYIKYSPSNVLDKEFGPEFKSLSTGLMLCF